MRTRFAPSPTGFLHIGGLRTALYSFLMAKKEKGVFLLRIEDTDQAREVPGAVENILRTLRKVGLPPDEGVLLDENGEVIERGPHGPYVQSRRLERYRRHAEELVTKGDAYCCFCTQERLEEMRKQQEARRQPPMYDRRCLALPKEETERRLAAGEPHVIRLKIPREETIAFDDDIRGHVAFQGTTVDDQVLLKSDGFPTYHLAHVVDDHFMETDLVIRGEEWLSSLPKHVLLFHCLGWQPPRYAHVPLILNKDKSKLSKRQNDVATEHYLEKGYLPEALLNFLALLGWNPGTTQEIFSLPELIEAFSLDRVQKAGAIFDLEKLDWLQGQWIRRIPPAEFALRIRPLVAARHPAAQNDRDFARKAALIQERITFFPEAPDMLGFFYAPPAVDVALLANAKQKVTKEALPTYLALLEEILAAIPPGDFRSERILAEVQAAIAEHGLKLGQLLWPLRALLTGRAYSPGAVEVAEVLGREETLRRIKDARERVGA